MLLDPRDWSLAFRSDEVIAGLRAGATRSRDAGDPRGRDGGHHGRASPGCRCGRGTGRAALELACARRPRAPRRRRRHAPDRGGERHGRLLSPALPRYRRVDARARPARADPRDARPRRGREPAGRGQAPEPAARAPAAPARPVGELPVLAGRATGFASTRTTVFDAFPRTGVARAFATTPTGSGGSTRCCARARSRIRPCCGGTPGCSRGYGTVEVRIMDAQTTVADVGALAALVQSLALLELERPDSPGDGPPANELIEENRFLAARDGMRALLIDVASGGRIAAVDQLDDVLAACRPRADAARLRARAQGGPAPRGGQRRIAPGRAGPARRSARRSPRASPAPTPPRCRCEADQAVGPARRAA